METYKVKKTETEQKSAVKAGLEKYVKLQTLS